MTIQITTTIEPTFRIEPEGKLYPSMAKLLADEILREKLENESADAVEFKLVELSKNIADEVKEKVKESLHIPRYKVLVQATIGTMKDQGVKITSRCLWDTNTDNYATASFQNEFIFASVLVFFLYTD